MDYSKLSDCEIAHMVSQKLPGRYITYADHVMDSETEETFDPCNNAADAWPIISANKISLHAPRYKEGWMADFTGSDDDVNDGFNVDYFESHNANPLRAAMIVFLMLQDSE